MDLMSYIAMTLGAPFLGALGTNPLNRDVPGAFRRDR